MKPKQHKQPFPWDQWLEALTHAPITEKVKAIGRAIPPLVKRTKRPIVPWELPTSPGYSELSPLVYAGLLRMVPGIGQFFPILDPLPIPASIPTTPAMRKIMRLVIRGADLYFSDRDNGYTYGWEMAIQPHGESTARSPHFDQRSCTKLLSLYLLEWDGCGNWPYFTRRRYRVDIRHAHGVKGFKAASERWIREGIERSTPCFK